jgi:hypothetical protein
MWFILCHYKRIIQLVYNEFKSKKLAQIAIILKKLRFLFKKPLTMFSVADILNILLGSEQKLQC